MKIGFTGTQHGMTVEQHLTLHKILKGSRRGLINNEFHHGDCIGADSEAHTLAKRFGWKTISHPPDNDKKRAYTKADVILMPTPYLARNHAIVRATDELIATPRQFKEQLRSGTWATIRYAKKIGRKVCIIFPDGSIETT